MIEPRLYQDGDVFRIVPREDTYRSPNLNFENSVALKYQGRAHTFWNGDEVVAISGIVVLWSGVSEIWMITSGAVKNMAKEFCRKCDLILDFYKESLSLNRIHVFVEESFAEGIRWAEFMGFHMEGTLKKYGPKGQDYVLMAWVRE